MMGEGCEELECSDIAGENVKWFSHFGKLLGTSSVLNLVLPSGPAIPFLQEN